MDIPITEAEVDVIVYERPVSIKTVSGPRIGGIKAVWTVDWEKVKEFVKDYKFHIFH